MALRSLLLYLAAGLVAGMGLWNALQGGGPLVSLAAGILVGGLVALASRKGNAS